MHSSEPCALTSYEPKSFIEVSSDHTPIILPSRKGSLDTNLDDLATTADASQVYDTTDVGRLTSPLFSQEREVSANTFSVSCSLTLSSVEKSSRDVEPSSCFGKPLSKGKRNRDPESVQDSQMEEKEFCPNKEIFTTSLKRKLIMLFKENSRSDKNI